MDERILAEGCRKGEETARRALYESFAGRLLGICLRYAGDRMTAEDLMHDAFLKIYGAFDRFAYRGPGSLRAWIERITVNVALEWLRSRNRLTCLPLDEGRAQEPVAEPDPGQVARIPRDVLMRFVAELPDGYRTVFNLYVVDDKSHKEIASLLGIKESTSASQLHKAKAMLARKIKQYRTSNSFLL